MWAPDVYEGAPKPSAAWLESASKLAGLHVFLGVAVAGTGARSPAIVSEAGNSGGWLTLVAILDATSCAGKLRLTTPKPTSGGCWLYSPSPHGRMLLGVMAFV